MTILHAGSFRVSDYRRAIPDWVKVVAAIRLVTQQPMLLNGMSAVIELARDLQYDHDPGLLYRDYDVAKGDFVPGQNDPNFIVARPKREHQEKTTGRKADAEKTVTTRGSDIGEARHTRKIVDTQKLHEAKLAAKRGDPEAIARILGGVRQKSRLRPKSRIPSRPFPNTKRPMRRRA